MGGVVEDVVSGVGDLGSSVDDFVNDEIPGGWGTVLAVTGATMGMPSGLGGVEGASSGGGLLESLGTATSADLSAAYDMGSIGSAGAGGFSPVASGGFFGGLGNTLSGLTTAQKIGLGTTALGLTGGLGGNKSTSSTTTSSIDPEMKAAYLRNLEEARGVASGLGQRQFAAFPEYNLGMVQNYMNPYQQEVIDKAMGDIERQRMTQMAQEGAQATASKAFGGSRQAVQRALVDEAALRQSGALGAQLRQQGFTQAQNLALQQEQLRQAYEQQKLDAARNLGLEQQNIRQGALGLQPANLGGSYTSPLYRNTSASALGGALGGASLGKMIGGTENPEYAGYGAGLGGLLGLIG